MGAWSGLGSGLGVRVRLRLRGRARARVRVRVEHGHLVRARGRLRARGRVRARVRVGHGHQLDDHRLAQRLRARVVRGEEEEQPVHQVRRRGLPGVHARRDEDEIAPLLGRERRAAATVPLGGRVEREVGGRGDRDQIEPPVLHGPAKALAPVARQLGGVEGVEEALQVGVGVREAVGEVVDLLLPRVLPVEAEGERENVVLAVAWRLVVVDLERARAVRVPFGDQLSA